jgi:drug/metabolite transporter (DMT)-like permease
MSTLLETKGRAPWGRGERLKTSSALSARSGTTRRHGAIPLRPGVYRRRRLPAKKCKKSRKDEATAPAENTVVPRGEKSLSIVRESFVRLTTFALTALALVAFASNSLLARMALGRGEIDAATFTAVRLAGGAAMLALIVRVRSGGWTALRVRGLTGPLALFAYAAAFSFAYVRIDASVGALVLFGVVQLAMIGYALVRGDRPDAPTWAGIALAALGLALLTLPSATAPDPLGVLLMAVAGAAWAAYSIAGGKLSDPIAANARSFLLGSVPAIVLVLASAASARASSRGIALALVSGAVTSGLGYACWYRVLPRLSVTQAAVAQLAVPIIAALAAVALLGESLHARLVVAGAAVLCGVALVSFKPGRTPAR